MVGYLLLNKRVPRSNPRREVLALALRRGPAQPDAQPQPPVRDLLVQMGFSTERGGAVTTLRVGASLFLERMIWEGPGMHRTRTGRGLPEAAKARLGKPVRGTRWRRRAGRRSASRQVTPTWEGNVRNRTTGSPATKASCGTAPSPPCERG